MKVSKPFAAAWRFVEAEQRAKKFEGHSKDLSPANVAGFECRLAKVGHRKAPLAVRSGATDDKCGWGFHCEPEVGGYPRQYENIPITVSMLGETKLLCGNGLNALPVTRTDKVR